MNRSRHVNLQETVDPGRNSASVKERQPARMHAARRRQNPAGQPCEIAEQAGINDRVGAEIDHGLIAEHFALEIEPVQQPEDEGVEKEGYAEQLADQLRHIIASSQVSHLVQQAGPAVRPGPVFPLRRHEHQRAEADQGHWRGDTGVHRQVQAPVQPQCGTAIGEELL